MELSDKGFTPTPITIGRRQNKKLVRGFTLIELLLAAAILAFVLSSLLLVFINCIILNESSRNFTVAISHAEFALEEIKDQGFSSIASSTWNNSTIVSKGLIPLGSESLVITVTGTGMNPKNINVTVNWRDRGVRNRSVTLETLLTEP